MAHLDFDHIAQLLREDDYHAHVAQTGGGTATIYAGNVYRDDRGDERYPVLIGPGYFRGPGWTNAAGDTDECYVGPDDDGETRPWFAGVMDNDETVAAAAVRYLNHTAHHTYRYDVSDWWCTRCDTVTDYCAGADAHALSFDEAEAAGRDGSGRGLY